MAFLPKGACQPAQFEVKALPREIFPVRGSYGEMELNRIDSNNRIEGLPNEQAGGPVSGLACR
jgi:hypothetical protein